MQSMVKDGANYEKRKFLDQKGARFLSDFYQFFIFKLQSVFLAYLGQIKSKSPIQGHFWKLEIKTFNLAPRFMGFYPLLMKIRAL